MIMNVTMGADPVNQLSDLLSQIRQPARIQILLINGADETCVCHIEAILGLRQAAISQHLMALRKAGLLTTKRDGRHIYYRLANPEVIDLLHHAGALVSIPPDTLDRYSIKPYPGCTCPQCNPEPGKDPIC